MILQVFLLSIVSLLPRYCVETLQFMPGNITACPGECVHSLTAILCDHVIEELPCNEPFLKCCVSKDLKLGTPVETSPPMPEDLEDVIYTENPNKDNIVTTTFSTTSIPNISNTSKSPPRTQNDSMPAISLSHNVASALEISNHKSCPGHCVEKQYARYCSHVLEESVCEKGICCSVRPTTVAPTTLRPVVLPVSSTLSPKPPCRGSCVSPLFSLLCDDIIENFYCPNDGRCCVNHPESPDKPTPGPCPGSCIPMFLSGVCNKPSKLILQTSDCKDGQICCFTPEIKEEIAASALRPTSTSVQPKPIIPQRPLVNRVPPPHHPVPHISEINPGKVDGHHSGSRPPEQPFCPGPCIASFLKFTCFGSSAIHDGFLCAKSGSVCCAPIIEIQKYDHIFHATDNFPTGSTLPDNKNPIANMYPPPYVCGLKGTQRRETPRIIGGFDSVPGEWCWQVALINAQNQYLCGGALIGISWVLTAAHCVTNLVRNGDVIYVRVGDHDLTSQYGSQGAQTHRVATTYIHHSHNSQTLDNDIALLKLQVSVDLNTSICLVCLPARGANRQAGKRCTVTGYGYRTEAGPISLKVRQTEIPIVDDQECSVKINAVTEKLFILPAGSFCAGGEKGNDACQGDGGGPLVCRIEDYYELTGLVSWGFGCGREDVPGVYVKVSTFIGWINQIISLNNT